MSDMHLKGKMRKVTEAAKQGTYVTERSKKAGLVLFLLFIGIGVIVLLALMIGFIKNENPVAATVTSLLAVFLTYCVYKLITTDDIRHL